MHETGAEFEWSHWSENRLEDLFQDSQPVHIITKDRKLFPRALRRLKLPSQSEPFFILTGSMPQIGHESWGAYLILPNKWQLSGGKMMPYHEVNGFSMVFLCIFHIVSHCSSFNGLV